MEIRSYVSDSRKWYDGFGKKAGALIAAAGLTALLSLNDFDFSSQGFDDSSNKIENSFDYMRAIGGKDYFSK